MPVMNGFEAVEELKSKSPNNNVPIYALTADITGKEHDYFNDHFDGFFTKPLQREIAEVLVKTFKGK